MYRDRMPRTLYYYHGSIVLYTSTLLCMDVNYMHTSAITNPDQFLQRWNSSQVWIFSNVHALAWTVDSCGGHVWFYLVYYSSSLDGLGAKKKNAWSARAYTNIILPFQSETNSKGRIRVTSRAPWTLRQERTCLRFALLWFVQLQHTPPRTRPINPCFLGNKVNSVLPLPDGRASRLQRGGQESNRCMPVWRHGSEHKARPRDVREMVTETYLQKVQN
jgi:hypothetical protein